MLVLSGVALQRVGSMLRGESAPFVPTFIYQAANVQQKSITSPAGVLVVENDIAKTISSILFELKSKVADFFFVECLTESHTFLWSASIQQSDAFIVHGAQCCSTAMRHSLPTSKEQQCTLHTAGSFRPQVCVCLGSDGVGKYRR